MLHDFQVSNIVVWQLLEAFGAHWGKWTLNPLHPFLPLASWIEGKRGQWCLGLPGLSSDCVDFAARISELPLASLSRSLVVQYFLLLCELPHFIKRKSYCWVSWGIFQGTQILLKGWQGLFQFLVSCTKFGINFTFSRNF